MKRFLLLIGIAAAPLAAQTTPPTNVTMSNGQPRAVTPSAIIDNNGKTLGTTDNPLVTTGGGGAVTATRTTAAGTSDTQAVPVQGVTGGVPQNVNNSQVAGFTISTGTGAAAAGTQRVTLATDSPLAPGAATAAAQATEAGYLSTLAGAIGARPTSNGLAVSPATDTVFPEYQRPTALTAGGIVPTTALNAVSLTGKAAPGNFYGATLAASTVAGYLVVANLTAAPASGTALTAAQVIYCAPVAAGGVVTAGGSGIPDTATVGVTVLFSTACATYTPVGTAALHIRVRAQ